MFPQTSSPALLAFFLVTIPLVLVVSVLLNTFILRLVIRMIAGFTPPFRRLLLVVAASSVAGVLLSVVIGFAFGPVLPSTGAQANPAAPVLASAISALASAALHVWLLGSMIRSPGGQPLGLRNSLICTLLLYGILVAISFLLMLAGLAALIFFRPEGGDAASLPHHAFLTRVPDILSSTDLPGKVRQILPGSVSRLCIW